MLFHGTIATSMSGSLNGTVFSHNRGGPYMRARTIPLDPITDEQQALRDTMAELADMWTNTLNTAERNTWSGFAKGNKHPNRIGELRPITGRAEFIRANMVRGQARYWLSDGRPYVTQPSSDGACCPISPSLVPSLVDAPTAEFSLNWDPSEEWATEPNAMLLWYISDPQPLVINWFRRPYTLAICPADNGASPTNGNVASIAPIPSGRRLFWRARISRADGRLSAPWTGIIET